MTRASGARDSDRPRRIAAGVGTAIGIVGAAAAVLLLPPVMDLGLEVGRSATLLGVPPDVARRASELSVQELLLGPGSFTFAVTPGGPPFYGPTEAAHMQTVRVVVYGFFGLVLASGVAVAFSLRGMTERDALRTIRRGATGLVVVLAVIGVGLVLAFDALFTLFHLIVFPAGGWRFDPATQRIVQLYPAPFWEFAAGSLAVISMVIALAVIGVTTMGLRGRRADGPARA